MADLTQTFGPFYGGMLQREQMNTQSSLAQNEAMRGTLGLLANMARQQEQNKLLEQQVNLAKLKAEQEMRSQAVQDRVLQMALGRMQGGQPAQAPLGMLSGVNPATATIGEMAGASVAPGGAAAPSPAPATGGMLFSPQEMQLLSIGGLKNITPAIQAGNLAQKQFEHENLSAAQREEARSRDRQHALEVQKFEQQMRQWGSLSGDQRVRLEMDLRDQVNKGRISQEEANRIISTPQAPQAAPSAGFEAGGYQKPGMQALTPDQILLQEREKAALAGDLNAVAEIDRERARLGARPGANPARVNDASLNAQQSTLPIQVSPDQRRKLEEERPQATYALRSNTANLDRLEKSASDLLTHKGLSGITGIMGAVVNIPGSAASDAEARLDTLKTQVFTNTLQAMRDASKTGGALGQVTDREGKRLEGALAALEKAQSLTAMKTSLREIVKIAQESKSRLTEQYNMTYPRERIQVIPPEGTAAQQAPQGNAVDFRTLR